MRNYIIIVLASLVVQVGMAQSGFDYTYKRYAPKHDPKAIADIGGYALSSKKYKDRYGDEVLSSTIMLQLGDNYRLNGQPVEAALWYSRGIDQIRSPEDHLYYAQMLKMIGQCEEANVQYSIYSEKKGIFKQSICIDIEADEIENKVTFEHLSLINSPGSDFAAIPWGEKLVFTSDREFTRPGAYHDPWTMRNYSGLFYAERDKSGRWSTVKRFREIDSRYNDGVASIDPAGQTLYFTRNNRNGLNKHQIRDLNLHAAYKEGSGWKDKFSFPFNNTDYGTCHPAVSPDGKMIVFASDMPGGSGGMDLYYAERTGDVWGKPINLGDQINTAGNELFPSISSDGYLFFASDGHPGFGGLDVFVAIPDEGNKWFVPRNLGNQVNSSYDDFSLVTFPGRKAGYISSNKPGGHGLDDIYYWTSEKPLGDIGIASGEVLVLDIETGLPIPDARLYIGKISLSANNAGRVKVRSPAMGTQPVKAEAEGFIPLLDSLQLPSKELQVIRMAPAVYQPYLFVGRDINTRVPIQDATIEVFELHPNGTLTPLMNDANQQNYAVQQTGDPSQVVTPVHDGYATSLPWILDSRKRYQIRAKAKGYLSGFIELSAPEIMGRGPLTRKPVDMEPVILGIEEKDLTTGATFKLDGIYYDYDKASIRADARGNLDELARLMLKFPNMMIELSSHTDSRGKDLYNLDLSQRRADAAIAYLNALGIAEDRLVARGYGERKLVNKCADNVNCSEEDHQLNRRTEFRIIRM